jgi:hypothetical protein
MEYGNKISVRLCCEQEKNVVEGESVVQKGVLLFLFCFIIRDVGPGVCFIIASVEGKLNPKEGTVEKKSQRHEGSALSWWRDSFSFVSRIK